MTEASFWPETQPAEEKAAIFSWSRQTRAETAPGAGPMADRERMWDTSSSRRMMADMWWWAARTHMPWERSCSGWSR